MCIRDRSYACSREGQRRGPRCVLVPDSSRCWWRGVSVYKFTMTAGWICNGLRSCGYWFQWNWKACVLPNLIDRHLFSANSLSSIYMLMQLGEYEFARDFLVKMVVRRLSFRLAPWCCPCLVTWLYISLRRVGKWFEALEQWVSIWVLAMRSWLKYRLVKFTNE